MCVGQSEKWAKHTHTAAHRGKQMRPWREGAWQSEGRVSGLLDGEVGGEAADVPLAAGQQTSVCVGGPSQVSCWDAGRHGGRPAHSTLRAVRAKGIFGVTDFGCQLKHLWDSVPQTENQICSGGSSGKLGPWEELPTARA